MNDYAKIKSGWKNVGPNQIPNDFKVIEKRAQQIIAKQLILKVILVITLAILVFSFIYVSGYKVNTVSLGFGLMIGSLTLRIILEFILTINKPESTVTSSHIDYLNYLKRYYKYRIWTHAVATPILLLCYITGFVILLPYFEESLSAGFFLYIKISGLISMGVLVILIIVQSRKELRNLREIREDQESF